MGSAASSTVLRRRLAASSPFRPAAANSPARDTTTSAAAAAGTEPAAAEGAQAAFERGTAAALEGAAGSAEDAAAVAAPAPYGSSAAAGGRAAAAAAGTFRRRLSFLNPLRVWKCNRKRLLLQREKGTASASRLLSSSPVSSAFSPCNTSTTRSGGSPAVAVADSSPHAFPAASWVPSSSIFAFAAALLRQQRSFPRRCVVFLQLLHAVVWWAAATSSLTCSRMAAAVLAFPFSLPPSPGRRKEVHGEAARRREAGAPTAAPSHTTAATAAAEETAAAAGVAAAAADVAAVETATADVTAADATAAHITEASTAATGTAAEDERENTHDSSSALRLRFGTHSTEGDENSVMPGRIGNTSSGTWKSFVQQPSCLRGEGKNEIVMYVFDWKGWTFLGVAAAAALVSGLSVGLLWLWRNDWEAIDATIFSITGRHNHYAYTLVLITVVFSVYSSLLLLCVCACLLPRLFLSASLTVSPSQSPSKEHGHLLYSSGESPVSLDAGRCAAAAARKSPCSNVDSCCSKASDNSADPRKSPPLHSGGARGCSNTCTPLCPPAGSSGTLLGTGLRMARSTYRQVALVKSTSQTDTVVLPHYQELELPVSDGVCCCSFDSHDAAAAPAPVEDVLERTSPAFFSHSVAAALSRTASMGGADKPCSCGSFSAPMHKASTEEEARLSATAATLPPAVCRLHSSQSAAGLAPRTTSAAPTTAAMRRVLRRAGSASNTAAAHTRSFSDRSAGTDSALFACSLYCTAAGQPAAAGGAAAAVRGGALPATAASAVPPSTYVAFCPNAHEEATAAGDLAKAEASSTACGGEEAACTPLLVPERQVVVRLSLVHIILLFAILLMEVNFYTWTLYLGIELYHYLPFFFHFYAPFIYAGLLPLLTLLLVAVLLAPVYGSPAVLQVFASAAQPPYPSTYLPLLHPDAALSAAALFSPDAPVSVAYAAASSPTKCPGSALPADHQECVDWFSPPLLSLRLPAAHVREAPSRAPLASASARPADAAAGPFDPPAALSSSLPRLPGSAVTVAEEACAASSSDAAAAISAARGGAVSAEIALRHTAAYGRLRSTAPSAESQAGAATTSTNCLLAVSPATVHRAAADPAADTVAEVCESEPVAAATSRGTDLRLRKLFTWGKPQQQRQQRQLQEQEQEHAPVAAEDYEEQVQQKKQQEEQYFFLKGVAPLKAKKIMNSSIQLWCFVLLVLLWVLFLVVPFLPFFTSSPCLLRRHRQQKQPQQYTPPFRSRPPASSDATVETAGKGKSSRKKEKAARKLTRRANEVALARAEQQRGTEATRGETAAVSTATAPTGTAVTSSAKAATAAKMAGQDVNVLGRLDSRGKTRRPATRATTVPSSPSAESEKADEDVTPAAAQAARAGVAIPVKEAREAEEAPAAAAQGLISTGRDRLAEAWAAKPSETRAAASGATAPPPVRDPITTSSPVATAEGGGTGKKKEGEGEGPAAAAQGTVGGRQDFVGGVAEEKGTAAVRDTVAASVAAAVATDATAEPLSEAKEAGEAAKETATRVASCSRPAEAAPEKELAAEHDQPRRLSSLAAEWATAASGAAAAASGLRAPLEVNKEPGIKKRGSDSAALALGGKNQAFSREKTQLAPNVASVKNKAASQWFLGEDTQRAASPRSDDTEPATAEMMLPVQPRSADAIRSLQDISLAASRSAATPSAAPRIAGEVEVPVAHAEKLRVASGISMEANVDTSSAPDAPAKASQPSFEFDAPAGVPLYPAGEAEGCAFAGAAARSDFAAVMHFSPFTTAATAPSFQASVDVMARKDAVTEGPALARRVAASERETAAAGHWTAAAGGRVGAGDAAAAEENRTSARNASAAERGGKGGHEAAPAAEEASRRQCSRGLQGTWRAAEGERATRTAAAAVRDDIVQGRDKDTPAADVAGGTVHQETASRPGQGLTVSTAGAEAAGGGRGGDAGGADTEETRLVDDTKGNGEKTMHCAEKDQEATSLPSDNDESKEADASSPCATETQESSFLQWIVPTPVWCAAADLALWVVDAWEEVQRDPFTLLPPKPLLIGHRGLPAVRPENTEASFAAASETCDALEADVNISQDGVLLLVHDETFRRTTDVATVFPEKADDEIHSFDWESIQKLNAGKWWLDADPFGYRSRLDQATQSVIATQRVPSFEALLRHLVKTQKKLIFDLHCPACKDSTWGCGGRCVSRVKALLRSTNSGNYMLWMQDGKEEIKREFPEATIVRKVFGGRFNAEAEDRDEPLAEVLNSDWRYSPAASVRKWAEAGYWVNLYVVTEPWILSYFWCAGTVSVTTDNCISTRSQQAPVYVYTLYAFRFFALLLDAACILLVILCLLLRRYCGNTSTISFFVAAAAAGEKEAGVEDQERRRASTCYPDTPHKECAPFACGGGNNAPERRSADSSATSEAAARSCPPPPRRNGSSCSSL